MHPTLLPPTAPAPAAATDVMTRQVILDGRSSIFGYELLHRYSDAPPNKTRDAAMLVHALSLTDSSARADRKPLFLRLTHDTLASGHLALLDPKRLVIEVGLPQADRIAAATLTLRSLHERGFRLAFDQRILGTPWRSWLPLASFIRIDLSRLEGGAVAAVVGQARRQPAAKVIAINVQTPAQHIQAGELGVRLFQGDWFARRTPTRARSMRPGQATIIQLMNLVRREAPTAKIEEVLKRDPALSFNLLRFVNCSGYGICEVTSFRQAVMLLGLKKLFRWAALLMATAGNGAPAIGQTALIRGRFMELLAAEMMGPEERDDAFVVGIFSLLDVMLGMPLEAALECVSLPVAVVDALLHRRGAIAPLLELTRACESADNEAFSRAAAALLLTDEQVNAAHLEAIAWAEALLD